MKKRIFVIVAVLTVLFVLWNLKTQNDSGVRFEVESHNVEINGLKVHYATACESPKSTLGTASRNWIIV